ncbi:MAG TPA: helix-hairpin-helix domain-containing protein [Armatimonadota bacterium]|jgi:competence protein ComEA
MRWYFSRKEQFAVVVLLLAIAGAVLVISISARTRERDRTAQTPFYAPPPALGTVTPPNSSTTPVLYYVHVTGAVKKPGVYRCQPGARINDAVQQAGGAREDGDPDALNLAAKVEDGEKIYLPTKAESQQTRAQQGPPPLVETAATHPSSTTVSASATRASAPSGAQSATPTVRERKEPPKEKIALNSATLEQLQQVPGIGPVTAQTILDYRAQHGKFTELTQLLDIPRIGPKTMEKLAQYLTL